MGKMKPRRGLCGIAQWKLGSCGQKYRVKTVNGNNSHSEDQKLNKKVLDGINWDEMIFMETLTKWSKQSSSNHGVMVNSAENTQNL